ncbi:MAG: large subunit ribosomal protein [Chloroflexota bacterium]|nr:large subunit ribosomal protein [Chloroflexota bacterium]
MTRVKRGVTARRRHKKILALTAGQYGARHRLFKTANEAMLHALSYQYRDRRNRKRDFHRLWITRINAAARQHGLSYSKFMAALAASGVEINRKMLAELAVNNQPEFAALVAAVKVTA